MDDRADVRFERSLTDGRTFLRDTQLSPEIAVGLFADVKLSTYARDFVPPGCVASRVTGKRPPPATASSCRAAARTACERATVWPQTNVKYSGPAPAEPPAENKSEYWWTHGRLGGRIIAERMHPKRTKRC